MLEKQIMDFALQRYSQSDKPQSGFRFHGFGKARSRREKLMNILHYKILHFCRYEL